MPTDPEDVLSDAAEGPAEVSGDAGTVKQQPLGDLIKYADRGAATDAASKAHRGLRFTRLVPPGATGE